MSPALTHRSGHVLSWLSPERDGYPYPEISGYLLTLLAVAGVASPRRADLATALCVAPGATAGVGRHGIDYTFDTAMALRGLIRSGDGRPLVQQTIVRWGDVLLGRVLGRAAVLAPPGSSLPVRWSTQFGAHEGKVAGAVLDFLAWQGDDPDPRGALVLDQLARDTLALQLPEGRFREHGASDLTYVHAHCYAVEGLLAQRDAGRPGLDDAIRHGVRWLVQAQDPTGGQRAWSGPAGPAGPVRLDASAQALRLFRLVEPDSHTDAIVAAREFLAEHARGDGGWPYEPGSAHLNSWATLFALQGLAPTGSPLLARSGRSLV